MTPPGSPAAVRAGVVLNELPAPGVAAAGLPVAPSGPCLDRTAQIALSVVMPAFNEAGNIAAALDEITEHVLGQVPGAEIVVVDDGSRDGTADAVQRWAAADARVRLVRQQNGGHGPALVRGIREARGTFCLLLDSDRQIGLERFAESWSLCGAHEAVFGVRRRRDDPVHRLALSRVLRAGLRLSCGVRAADANAPYKLVRRSVLLEALATMPAQPRIPSVLLTVYLRRRGARIAEQAVPHRRRFAGEPSLRLGRLVRFCERATAELARFRLGF